MIVFYVVLLALILSGMRWRIRDTWNEQCLSREGCQPIKGVFVIMVLISHASGYLDVSRCAGVAWADKMWRFCNENIGQLMVSMFFFYSGYGVMMRIAKDRQKYLQSMPMKRIFRTLIRFDIAVIVFVVLSFVIGDGVGWRQFALSLLAWDSVGNSNWYVFMILVCYAATYLCFSCFADRGKIWPAIWVQTAVLLVVMVVLSQCRDSYWYNTFMAYPAGMVVALLGERLIPAVKRNCMFVLVALLVMLLGLHVFEHYSSWQSFGLLPNMKSVLFAFLIVSITMRVQIGNGILHWFGENLFLVYIYQRVPMILLATCFPVFTFGHPYLYVLGSIAATVVIVCACNHMFMLRSWFNMKGDFVK